MFRADRAREATPLEVPVLKQLMTFKRLANNLHLDKCDATAGFKLTDIFFDVLKIPVIFRTDNGMYLIANVVQKCQILPVKMASAVSK